MRLLACPRSPSRMKLWREKNRVDDLRHDGVVVADDAGENCSVVALAQAGDQVVAQFVFHAAGAQTFFGKWTAAQFAERACKTHEEPPGKYFSGLYAVRGFGFLFVDLNKISEIFNTGGHRVHRVMLRAREF